MLSAADIDRGLPTGARDALGRLLLWVLADRRRRSAVEAAVLQARLPAGSPVGQPGSAAEARATACLRGAGLLGEQAPTQGEPTTRRGRVDPPWGALVAARLERYAEVARSVRFGRSLAAQLGQTRSLLAAELYFEVHELLEPAWRASRGEEREVLRGLIQAAVAWYHWQRGNPGGALRLARAAAGRLAPRQARWRGFDVPAVARASRSWAEWLARGEPTSPPPRPFLTP